MDIKKKISMTSIMTSFWNIKCIWIKNYWYKIFIIIIGNHYWTFNLREHKTIVKGRINGGSVDLRTVRHTYKNCLLNYFLLFNVETLGHHYLVLLAFEITTNFRALWWKNGSQWIGLQPYECIENTFDNNERSKILNNFRLFFRWKMIISKISL